jgi:prepilin-type N-terminal cleavage/methylation domain-containing protein
MLKRQRNLPTSKRSGAAAGESPALRLRAGFTMVEMMVAVMILAVGLLGLASTAAYLVRLVGGGAQQGIAANVIQSRFEWIRSVRCEDIVQGKAVTRGVTEEWRPRTVSNKVLSVEYRARYAVNGSKQESKTLTYTIMVPCW